MRIYVVILRSLFATALMASLVFPTGHCLGWQDDPFDPFGSDGTEIQDATDDQATPSGDLPAIEDTLSEGVKMIVRNLRSSDPDTAEGLARAIKTLLNVRQYSEAKVYLDRLIGKSLTELQIFDLMNQMGPDFFLDLQTQAELQPQGSEFALNAFKAANRAAYAPDRISRLIEQLSDDDRYIRSEAAGSLREVGAPAAAEMLNQCGRNGNNKQTPYILAALKQMGDAALLPMLGAARNDGTIPQAVAISVLANIDSEFATDALCRAAISSGVTPTTRAIAADAIARQGLLASGDIQQRIVHQAKRYLDGDIKLAANSQGNVTVWYWDGDKKRLSPTTLPANDAVKLLAVDLARDAYRLNQFDVANRQLQILTVLEANKRVIGPNRETMVSELSRYVNDANSSDLDIALGSAMDQDLIAAAIGACELMGTTGDASLVAAAGSEHRNLIKAVMHGNRHLQFAAANAIRRIDPRQAYPGDSYVAKFMTFLSQSTATGSGIVAHPRPGAAHRLASFMAQSGLQGRVAFSPQQLVAELNSNPDLELVLITDSFSNPHYLELVQQVRRNWLTRKLPIGLIVRDNRRRQAELVLEHDPLTTVLPMTSAPELIYEQLQDILAFNEPWPLSNTQRDLHSEMAIEWIDQAVANPETYEFYHLACFREQLARLLGTADNWELKSNIVGNLGTPDAQRELVNLAGQSGLPVSDRQIVANAFDRSVQKSGLLLTTSEILEQYDRYNASQKQSVESQGILSSILDTIESKSKR